VPFNRTTIRALAASMAMLTAGGTVAAAAVFHLPVLGFEAAGASASQGHLEAAVVDTAKPVAPRRVVKTRIVTEIVHHHAAASAAAAPTGVAAPASVAPPASAASSGAMVPTAPPVAQPPVAPAPGSGDGHEGDDETHELGHDGHGGEGGDAPGTGQPAGGTQVGG
jgi:hypothetical protein